MNKMNPAVEKEVIAAVKMLCDLITVKAEAEKKLAVANPNSELPQLVSSVAQLLSAL